MPEPTIRLRPRRRALPIRIAAVGLAALSALVVARDLRTLQRRSADLGPLVEVPSAARDLPLGRVLRASDLTTVERHRSQVPAGTVGSATDALGRTLVVPLVAGSPVPARALAPAERRGTAALVPAGMQALRVVADDAIIPPVGATVSVLAAGTDAGAGALGLDEGATAGAVTGGDTGAAAVVASAARVLAVETPEDNEGDVRRAVGVTLLVTPDEALRIASASVAGPLILTLEPPEDACCPPTAP